MTKQPKIGRPFKEDKPLSEAVLVLFNEDEKAALKNKAEEMNTSMSDLVRKKFRGYDELEDFQQETIRTVTQLTARLIEFVETGQEDVDIKTVLAALDKIDEGITELTEEAEKTRILRRILNE